MSDEKPTVWLQADSTKVMLGFGDLNLRQRLFVMWGAFIGRTMTFSGACVLSVRHENSKQVMLTPTPALSPPL